ncbi:MAG: cupin domain-containing protein [Candidatus Kariarchaeaceae archaeon]
MSDKVIKEELDWVFNRNSDAKALVRQLGEGLNTRIFVGKDTMLSFVKIEPNTEGSIHKHPEEQWGLLLEGKCVRLQDGVEIEMSGGDFWYSPPNVLHGIRTTDTSAVVLDIFSPPRPAYRSEGEGFGVMSE